MEASSSGGASGSSSSKQGLLGLPAENLAQIISYIPRKSLFPILVVSHQFHQLASAALYRNLSFNLAQSDIPVRLRDASFRLADALHTILTSSYDYAQHVKVFTLRMVESDIDPIQKRIAAKFLATEEAGMLLNTALLVMIRRAKGLEQFNWQVPIECNGHIYQALSNIASLQALHIHFDVFSVSKHNYNSYGAPPPPPGPIFGNPQASVWGDPMLSGNLPPGSIPSAGSLSKPPKSSQTRTKLKSRKLGTIKGLQSLSVTAIDDLSCLEEISLCLKGSSGSLKSLTLSFAESLVSKSQKPHPSNAHNAIHIQEDDATTEPNSPDMTATNTVPTDLDLKREKQAQDQALARIFGLDKGSVSDQKQDKRVEKTLKHTAKSARLSKPDSKTLDNLALHILSTVQLSKLELNIRSKIQDLLEAIIPPSTAPGHKHSSKKHKNASASKKSKYHGNVPPSSMPPGNSGQPSNEFWTGEEIDLLGPGPSKASQNNINIFGGPEYTPSTIPSMPPPPLLDWSSNNSLALSSNPPKNAFGFGDPSNFPLNGPKSHLAPVYPVPSPSSYAYHPNASSHMLSSVSQSVPSYGSIYQSGLLQKLQAQIQFLIIKAKQAGTNPSTIPFDKLLLGLPPEIAKQAKNAISIQANMSHQSHGSFPGKKKKPLPTATITPSDSSPESSSESESDSESSTVQASSNPNNNVDSLDNLISDFDMEHPDLLESEGEEDTDDQDHADRDEKEKSGQESPAAKEDPTVDVIGKGKQKVVLDDAPPPIPVVCNHDALPGDVKEVAKLSTVEESIQEYVRMTHGLSIQELTLSFIPLKSSVLAKALDLTTLRRIVFHNVGAQGAFWAMVEKLVDQGVVFNFQSLLVDDVSAAFISCLGKLPGLKSLHVLRRSNKEFSNTSSKSAVTLSDLHKLGLSKHYETLQSLSVTNLEDDSWDFDDRIIRALSSKAKKLKELAFSVDSNSFHTFLRCLPGLKNLAALHLINIKVSTAPTPLLPHNEWKKLILDVICYYPSLKLKYVGMALVNQGKVSQIGEKPKMSISSWYKKQDDQQQASNGTAGAAVGSTKSNAKGKGKAIIPPKVAALIPQQVPPPLSSSAPPRSTYDSSDPDDERPNVYYAKAYRTTALADSYAIYSNLVLRGRL